MEKGKGEGRGSRSATETYEVLGVSKVVTEGARGEFHNFRDVPQTVHICWSPVEEVKLSKYKT